MKKLPPISYSAYYYDVVHMIALGVLLLSLLRTVLSLEEKNPLDTVDDPDWERKAKDYYACRASVLEQITRAVDHATEEYEKMRVRAGNRKKAYCGYSVSYRMMFFYYVIVLISVGVGVLLGFIFVNHGFGDSRVWGLIVIFLSWAYFYLSENRTSLL